MHKYLSMFYFAVAVSQNRRIVKVWKGAQNMDKQKLLDIIQAAKDESSEDLNKIFDDDLTGRLAAEIALSHLAAKLYGYIIEAE